MIAPSAIVSTQRINDAKISINDQNVKSSREVKVDDVITIRKEQINFEVKVIGFPKSRVGAKLVPDYTKDVTPESELKKLEMLRFSKGLYRDKGTGRPTKRDRRDSPLSKSILRGNRALNQKTSKAYPI